jgi:hypothetical protein
MERLLSRRTLVGTVLCGTIATSALSELAKMNRELDPRGRYDAVMKADGLFESQALPF